MLKDLLTQISRMRFKISSEARAKLWRRLSTLCQSDVPINKAVEFLSESETNGPAAAFLNQQAIGLKHRNFATAAAGWVPPEELLMIMITQEDRIDRGFTQAARIASTRAKLRGTLFSGLDLSFPARNLHRRCHRSSARSGAGNNDINIGSGNLETGLKKRTGLFEICRKLGPRGGAHDDSHPDHIDLVGPALDRRDAKTA